METDFGLKPGDLEMICRILEKEPNIEQALIFGSRAKGNYKPGSDVDIALKGKNLTSQSVTDVSFQLNEETIMPYKFDVLNYHTIQEPALVKHINSVGIVFYENIPKHEII
jgi:predicted nucleotidyltransferase